MLRFIVRACAVLAVLLPLSAAAQYPIPAGVNLHNGYLEVINEVHVPVDYLDGVAHVRGPSFLTMRHEETKVLYPHRGAVLNQCCLVAGTTYEFFAQYSNAATTARISITPRLCNIRGIPFGYSVVRVTGTIEHATMSKNWPYPYKGELHITVVDAGCPSG